MPLRFEWAATANRQPLRSVALATRAWELGAGPPWRATFEDPEDGYAAHRFGWIVPVLVGGNAASRRAVLELALAWIGDCPMEAGAPGWDSYSVAERIAYFAYLFSSLTEAERAAHERSVACVLVSLAAHASFLRTHLELRGDATNNHLINDARALYIAGTVLGDEGLRTEARYLIKHAATRMFVSGFLREGSSHYHLLLCRTFVELTAVARATGDARFEQELCERLLPMARAADLLVENVSAPLIGDISPDFAPDFLRSVGLAGRYLVEGLTRLHPSGWAALFVPRPPDPDQHVPRAHRETSLMTFPEAGYHRLDHARWVVLAHVNPLGYVAEWSHGHADLGSFIADWDHHPLLVDGGRSTYRSTPLGLYGRSVRSHNAISIDRHEPCLVHGLNGFPALFRGEYYRTQPTVALSRGDGCLTLRLDHRGFARLGDGIQIVRTITVDGQELKVWDEIRGVGRHRVETFFHFHPGVLVEMERGTQARCVLPGGQVIHFQAEHAAVAVAARGVEGPEPAGWYAPRYGHAVPCTTVTFTLDGPLPMQHRYVLRAA